MEGMWSVLRSKVAVFALAWAFQACSSCNGGPSGDVDTDTGADGDADADTDADAYTGT